MAKTTLWTGLDATLPTKFDDADNWDNGIPEAGDTIIFKDNAKDLDASLDQSALTGCTVKIYQSYTGKIGSSGSYFQIGATTLEIGEDYSVSTPSGSGRLNLDLGGEAATVTIHNSASSATDTGKMPIRLLLNDAAAVLRVRRGRVALAMEPSETSLVASIDQSWMDSQDSDSTLQIGAGVTMTTLTKTGGSCTMLCAATTATNSGGDLTIVRAGTITTLNANGGRVWPESTGTITTMNINGASVDETRCLAARTVTTTKLNSGSLKTNPAIVTRTNKITSDAAVLYSAAAA